MKKSVVGLFGFLLSAVISGSAVAGPAADELSICIADNTTGKERKILARWIFSAISVHPEMRDISTTTEKTRQRIDEETGNIVTKLITDSCSLQAKVALDVEGSSSFEFAFSSLGKIAMQELMSNKEVNASISNFEKYLDKKKFESVFSHK